MKKSILFCSAIFMFSSFGFASPTLITGTPNYLGYGLSPMFGHIINFDDLATDVTNSSSGYYQLPSNQYAAQGVASISNSPSSNPLYAAAFSQQSAPVYLTTGSSDNYAGDITITLEKPVDIIGIGVLSNDTSPVTLNALGASGNVLASYSVMTSSTSSTPENGYWAIEDMSSDIKGLEIKSPAGLGIDDLQFAPEPSSWALLGAGVLLLGLGALRKRAQ